LKLRPDEDPALDGHTARVCSLLQELAGEGGFVVVVSLCGSAYSLSVMERDNAKQGAGLG